MRNRRQFVPLMLVLAALAVSAVAFPHLPASVPTHWGVSGKPDQFDNRLEGALKLPLVMLFIWSVFGLIPRYDRLLFIKYRVRDSDSSTVHPVYDVIVAVMLSLLLAIHVIAISSAVGLVGVTQEPIWIALVTSVGAIATGNYLPRVTRRNAFIGVRFPWAYASEEVWRRTQRAGGYGMVAAGIAGLVGAIAVPSSPIKPLFVAMVAQAIIVMIYSYYLAHSRTVS